MLDSLIIGLIRTLHFVPLVGPLLLLRAYRSARPFTAWARLLPLLLASIYAYMIWGMNYEDLDLPVPLWYKCGLGAALIEFLAASVWLCLSSSERQR